MKEKDFRTDVLPLKNKLFRMAMRITLRREEAEDIVQDTLMRIWSCSEEKRIDNVEAFAMTVCRNLALDAVAKKERQNIAFDYSEHDRPDHTPGPYEQMARTERMNIVEQTINSLPEKQRTAMMLREVEGKNYKDIADVMGLTEADVKVSIFRARKAIKEKLTKTDRYGL